MYCFISILVAWSMRAMKYEHLRCFITSVITFFLQVVAGLHTYPAYKVMWGIRV